MKYKGEISGYNGTIWRTKLSQMGQESINNKKTLELEPNFDKYAKGIKMTYLICTLL